MTNWIKCSERLPETGKPVIAFGIVEESESGMRSVTEAYLCSFGYWSTFMSRYGSDSTDLLLLNHVTHWQPLPEAPNED